MKFGAERTARALTLRGTAIRFGCPRAWARLRENRFPQKEAAAMPKIKEAAASRASITFALSA